MAGPGSLARGGAARLLGCVGLALALPLAAGCSDLSATGGGGGSGGAGPVAAAVVEPTPEVEIVSPVAGSFLAAGRVAVEGRAHPARGGGAPVQAVRLNGQAVTVEADGTFRGFIDCVPGLNVVEASAVDAAGHRGATSVGVLAGDWLAASQQVPRAARLRVTDGALHALGKILEASLWATDIDGLLKSANPIYDTNLLWVQVWVDIQQVRFRDLAVHLDSQPDGVHVHAQVFDPVIDVTVQADLGLGAVTAPEPVTLVASEVGLTGRLTAALRADKTLRVGTADVALGFTDFRALPTSSLLTTIEPLVRGAVRRAIENKVKDAIGTSLQPLIDETLLEYLTPDPTKPFEVFGKSFLVDVRGEQVSFDHDGFEVRLSFDAPPVPASNGAAILAQRPGSYCTAGGSPAPALGPGVFVTVDDDACNRLLHGLWAGGVFDLDLDPAFLAAQGLTLPITLELGALKSFLPELASAGADDAPIGIRIRPGLPPLFSVPGSPDLVRLELGELGVEIVVDRGNGFEPLVRAACHADVGFRVGLTSDGLKFSAASHPRLRFDVRSEPLVELDDRRLEVLLTVLLTPMLPQLLNDAKVIPVPHLSQLTVFNAQAYPDGPERDHLSVTGDMAR